MPRFDFGESYFRDIRVLQLIREKLPVSISLGLWMTLLSYAISIPLGIRKAVSDGTPLRHLDVRRHHHRLRHPRLPVRDPAHHPLRRRLLLRDLPAARPDLRQLVARCSWPQQDRSIISGTSSCRSPRWRSPPSRPRRSSTKNSFLDEIRKQYVITARMKGLTERHVLYGHVFRNAMLIVDRRLSGRVHRRLLRRLAAHRDDLLARRARPPRLRIDRQPRLSGGLRDALHLLADGARREPHLRPHLHLDRSAHRFRDAGGLSVDVRLAREAPARDALDAGPRPDAAAGAAAASRLSPINRRRLANFKANRRGYLVVLDLPRRCSSCRSSPSSSPTTGRSSSPTRARSLFPIFVDYPEEKFGGFLAITDYRDPFDQRGDRGERLDDLAADPLLLRHRQQLDLPTPAPSAPTWCSTR